MRFTYGAGLNENQYPSLSEAAEGSYNFDLQKDISSLSPRKAFDLEGTAPNAADIRGILQLVKRDNSETTLVQTSSTVYKWGGGTTWSSVATAVTATCQWRDVYWALDDYILITDLAKQQPIMKWDGSTVSTATTGLSFVTAKYGVVHNSRVWLANVRTSTDTPH